MSKTRLDKVERIAAEAEGQAANALSVAYKASNMVEAIDGRLADLLAKLIKAGVVTAEDFLVTGSERGEC